MVDPILNSLNSHYKNFIVDSEENYKFDLGVTGLTPLTPSITYTVLLISYMAFHFFKGILGKMGSKEMSKVKNKFSCFEKAFN